MPVAAIADAGHRLVRRAPFSAEGLISLSVSSAQNKKAPSGAFLFFIKKHPGC